MTHEDEVGRSASTCPLVQRRRPVGVAAGAVVSGLAFGLWWFGRAGLPGDWADDLGDRLLGPAAFLGPYFVVAATAAGGRVPRSTRRVLAGELGAVCLLSVPLATNAPYREPYSGYAAALLIGLQCAVAAAGLVGVLVLRGAAAEPLVAPDPRRH